MDANSLGRLARSCASINYKPIYALVNLVTIPNLPENPLLDGLVSAQNIMPWVNTASPGVAEFRRVLSRYAPGHSPSAAGIAGWAAAQLLQMAASNLSDPPTSQNILDGLWAMKGNDLGGITGPLTYNRGQNNPVPFCYWIIQIQRGNYVSPNNFQRTCK
jgi:branched-chain amino acid transport system substrate-binding protein